MMTKKVKPMFIEAVHIINWTLKNRYTVCNESCIVKRINIRISRANDDVVNVSVESRDFIISPSYIFHITSKLFYF